MRYVWLSVLLFSCDIQVYKPGQEIAPLPQDCGYANYMLIFVPVIGTIGWCIFPPGGDE